MNHCVPEFEMEKDDSNFTSFGRRHKKSSPEEDELVELLWQNGQVVHQSQNQRSVKKSPTESMAKIVQPTTTEEAPYRVFMQEDEMASWLHYPLDDDFCSDLLYPSYSQSSKVTQIPGTAVAPPPAPPPIPPTRRVELLDSQTSKFHNFMHFSRPTTKMESSQQQQPSQPSVSDKAVRESTVVDSSDTPVVMTRGGKGKMSKSQVPVSSSYGDGAAELGKEMATCDLSVTSSSGGSGASAEPLATALMDERKRKASRMDDQDCNNDENRSSIEDIQRRLVRPTSRYSPTQTSIVKSQNPSNNLSQICSVRTKGEENGTESSKKLEDYLNPFLLATICSKISDQGVEGEVKLSNSKKFDWPVEELKSLVTDSRCEKKKRGWSDVAFDLSDNFDGDSWGGYKRGGGGGAEEEGRQVCSPFEGFEMTVTKLFKK